MVVGDDHPLFRDGVVRALSASGSIDVVAEADDGVAALALIREHGPQVALLDYRMPGLDGAQVAAAVRRDQLPTRVLLISAHDESAIVYNALQEGAAGFISKESSRSELVDAVLSCAKGHDVVAPSLAAGLVGEIQRRNESDAPTLSAREREVLGYIAGGQTIPAMAKEMFLAPSTVKTHVQRLYEKLGVERPGLRGRRGDAPRVAGVAVDRASRQLVDYFAAEPVRVSALLRLPLIGLIGFLVWIWEVDSWLPEVYAAILGAYSIAAVLWAVAVFRGPVPTWGGRLSTGVDVLAVVALCVVSGGATAALLPVFFLLPLSVAFGDRPVFTGVLGISTAACYLGRVDRLLEARRPRRDCPTWSICRSASWSGWRWPRPPCASC